MLHEQTMKVKARDRDIGEILAALRRADERVDNCNALHAKQRDRWRVDQARLEKALEEAVTGAEQVAVVDPTAEAGLGTTRKLAVDRPASSGAPKRLRMGLEVAASAESEEIADLKEAARKERNAAADELDAVRDELPSWASSNTLLGSGARALVRRGRLCKGRSGSRRASSGSSTGLSRQSRSRQHVVSICARPHPIQSIPNYPTDPVGKMASQV